MKRTIYLITTVILLGMLVACAAPAAPAQTGDAAAESTTGSAEENTSDTDVSAETEESDTSLFPMTITDAVGIEHTFETAPRIGCLWYGCRGARSTCCNWAMSWPRARG